MCILTVQDVKYFKYFYCSPIIWNQLFNMCLQDKKTCIISVLVAIVTYLSVTLGTVPTVLVAIVTYLGESIILVTLGTVPTVLVAVRYLCVLPTKPAVDSYGEPRSEKYKFKIFAFVLMKMYLSVKLVLMSTPDPIIK